MKKGLRLLLTAMVVLLFSATALGAGSTLVPLEKAGKVLGKKSGTGYIFGVFNLVHTMNKDIIRGGDAADLVDINSNCRTKLKIILTNLDTRKDYELQLMPISGSSSVYYKEKYMNDNSNNPCSVMALPVGTYQLTRVEAVCAFQIQGYHNDNFKFLDRPYTMYNKQNASFSVKENQMVYVGNFTADFITYFGFSRSYIMPFNILRIRMTNNFEKDKAIFMEKAPEKVQSKLNGLEFVSRL